MKTHRRTVATLAGPGIAAAREVYLLPVSDAVRVAALVEISAAAAALARTVVKLRRLDPDLIAPHVADRTDLRAVLGRGRWLPTMVRHVPAPASGPVDLAALLPAVVPAVPARSVRRRAARRAVADQGSLFALAAAGGWPVMAAQSGAGRRRLCAHVDEDGRGMHWLEPGERCPRAPADSRPSQPVADNFVVAPHGEVA